MPLGHLRKLLLRSVDALSFLRRSAAVLRSLLQTAVEPAGAEVVDEVLNVVDVLRHLLVAEVLFFPETRLHVLQLAFNLAAVVRLLELVPLLPGVQTTLQLLLVLPMRVKAAVWAVLSRPRGMGGQQRHPVSERVIAELCRLPHVCVSLVALVYEIQRAPHASCASLRQRDVLPTLSAQQRLTLHPSRLLFEIGQSCRLRLELAHCVLLRLDKLPVDIDISQLSR